MWVGQCKRPVIRSCASRCSDTGEKTRTLSRHRSAQSDDRPVQTAHHSDISFQQEHHHPRPPHHSPHPPAGATGGPQSHPSPSPRNPIRATLLKEARRLSQERAQAHTRHTNTAEQTQTRTQKHTHTSDVDCRSAHSTTTPDNIGIVVAARCRSRLPQRRRRRRWCRLEHGEHPALSTEVVDEPGQRQQSLSVPYVRVEFWSVSRTVFISQWWVYAWLDGEGVDGLPREVGRLVKGGGKGRRMGGWDDTGKRCRAKRAHVQAGFYGNNPVVYG